MFVRSSDGRRMTELHSISVMSPSADLADDGVWKVFINGGNYGVYSLEETAVGIMDDVVKSLKEREIIYEMPKDF